MRLRPGDFESLIFSADEWISFSLEDLRKNQPIREKLFKVLGCDGAMKSAWKCHFDCLGDHSDPWMRTNRENSNCNNCLVMLQLYSGIE